MAANRPTVERTDLSTPAPVRRSDLLALRRDLGDFAIPAPRPLPRRPLLSLLAPALRPLSVTTCADTPDHTLALTYDDGPDPDRTPALLDLLAARTVPATFFVLADAAVAHPHLVRRIVTDGHELALHGIDHTRLTTLDDRAAVAVVATALDRVQQVAGIPVRLFRPAYGAHTPRTLRGWRRLGLDVVLWSGWAHDWQDVPAATVTGRALAATHPGGVLLLHDTRADPAPDDPVPGFDPARATSGLLDALPGWTFRTVTDLLARHRRVRTVARDLWT